jgi:hypothetical protein
VTVSSVVDQFVRRLHDLPDVEEAHPLGSKDELTATPSPPPVTTAVAPDDDPRSVSQGYLNRAPQGIDARYAWEFRGGDGAGTGFVLLEKGSNLKHEDLTAANVTLISGTSTAPFNHGTSMLGVVLMADNTLGGVGIAPAARGRVVSQVRAGADNAPAAILDAVAQMQFGDVLLLGGYALAPDNTQLPLEANDANYDAIRLATALGIVVIMPAGNSGRDLDAYATLAGGKRIFNRASADFRDSGALIVGAASAAAPHARTSAIGSSFGSRVDFYAWGESIVTTSTDAATGTTSEYTDNFGSTSGAAAIIAGAALALQGIAITSLGYRFAPLALRRLLAFGGTPSANPAADRVGVMPNLRAVVASAEVHLGPDVYVRDNVGDVGQPHVAPFSESPDIIVRRQPVANPQASFGQGSGTENDIFLGQEVLQGVKHSVYVRLRNRGGSAAANVAVDVYWVPGSAFVSPADWKRIGRVTLPTVPAANVLTVSPELPWPAAAVPPTGHYCYVAIAGSGQDPPPPPAQFLTYANFVKYVRNNNNVALRNFNVIPAPPSALAEAGTTDGAIHAFATAGTHVFPFQVSGAPDTEHVFAVEALASGLPRGSHAKLRVPMALARQLALPLAGLEADKDESHVFVPVNPFGTVKLGPGGALPRRSAAKCELHVRLPPTAYEPNDPHENRRRYEIAIRQLDGDDNSEVGRVTWHFGQPTHV